MKTPVKQEFRVDDYEFNTKFGLYPGRRFIHVTSILHLSDRQKLLTRILPLHFETVMLDRLCYRQYTSKQRYLIRGNYDEFRKL